MDAMIMAMIQHEESINNEADYNEYIRGYNSDPMEIEPEKESDAFNAGSIQAEIDNDSDW